MKSHLFLCLSHEGAQVSFGCLLYPCFKKYGPSQQYGGEAESLPGPIIKAEMIRVPNDLTIRYHKTGLDAIDHFVARRGKGIPGLPSGGNGVAGRFYVLKLQFKVGGAALAQHFPHGIELQGIKVNKNGIAKGGVIGITSLHGLIVLLLKRGVEPCDQRFIWVHR